MTASVTAIKVVHLWAEWIFHFLCHISFFQESNFLVFLALPYVTFAFYLENKSLSEYVVMVTGMVGKVITPRAWCYEREK